MDEINIDAADPRDEIVRLEDEIERLAAKIEGCRKLILASRVAVALGGILLLAMIFGAIRFEPAVMAASIVLVLGGIVMLGSNNSTANEAAAQLTAAEASRAELIGRVDLRVVGEPDGARRTM
jgi:hypothetical protein